MLKSPSNKIVPLSMSLTYSLSWVQNYSIYFRKQCSTRGPPSCTIWLSTSEATGTQGAKTPDWESQRRSEPSKQSEESQAVQRRRQRCAKAKQIVAMASKIPTSARLFNSSHAFGGCTSEKGEMKIKMAMYKNENKKKNSCELPALGQCMLQRPKAKNMGAISRATKDCTVLIN